MPQVPKLNGPQIQQAGFPSARVSGDASIEAFGGGASLDRVGAATNSLLEVQRQANVAEKQRADDLRTKEAYAQLRKQQTDLVWNPKTGAMNRKGKDALGVSEEYGSEFDKAADDIEKDLANDQQKAMFKEQRMRLRSELDEHLQKHTFGEMQKFEEETTEAGISVERDNAILNYQDPKAVANSLEMQKNFIMSSAQDNGKPAEWVKLKMEEAQGKTHSGIIERMLNNGEDMKASAYYKEAKDRGEISGVYQAHLDKVLEEGSLRGNSQRKSDEILNSYSDMGKALASARDIEDPKLRDEVTQRVKQRFQEKDAVDRDRTEKLHKYATDILDKTPDVHKIPVNTWTQFSEAQRSSLISYANKKRDGDLHTNWDDYYNLKTMASSSELQSKFEKLNLMEYRDKFADAEFKEIVSLQTSIRNKDGKADKALDGFRSDQAIVNEALSAAGFDPTPKPGTDEAKQVYEAKNRIDQEIKLHQERTGKKVNNEDVQRITDNLLLKGAVPGTGIDVPLFGKVFQDTKHRFELNKGETIDIEPKDIPTLERKKIEDALNKRKLPVTDQAVLELYTRKLGNKRGS